MEMSSNGQAATTLPKELEEFIRGIPKVELHLHLEGTMEPAMLLHFAHRNSVKIDFDSVEEIQNSYKFTCLADFLHLYYQGMDVLLQEIDFYELAWAYLQKVHQENVRHVEVFFDAQPHMERGVPFGTIVDGFTRALQQAEKEFALTGKLIMCFVRHLSVEHAMETLEISRPYRHLIAAVGLDSTETGNPPKKYEVLFERAREMGYECVAHAGEEGPPSYIEGSLEFLKAKRIDHGVRCSEDPALVARLARDRVPLTVCPISNCKLCVFQSMKDHNIKSLLDQGVCVTINSDDPAYFGGYITDNFLAVASEPALQVTRDDIIKFVQNSIDATLLTDEEKSKLQRELDEYCATFSS